MLEFSLCVIFLSGALLVARMIVQAREPWIGVVRVPEVDLDTGAVGRPARSPRRAPLRARGYRAA